jgi:hypothetical protein
VLLLERPHLPLGAEAEPDLAHGLPAVLEDAIGNG